MSKLAVFNLTVVIVLMGLLAVHVVKEHNERERYMTVVVREFFSRQTTIIPQGYSLSGPIPRGAVQIKEAE